MGKVMTPSIMNLIVLKISPQWNDEDVENETLQPPPSATTTDSIQVSDDWEKSWGWMKLRIYEWQRTDKRPLEEFPRILSQEWVKTDNEMSEPCYSQCSS